MAGKRVKVISPDGKSGSVPEEQLAAALAAGYKAADGSTGAAPTHDEQESTSKVSEAAEGEPTGDDSSSMLGSVLRQVPGVVGGVLSGAAKGAVDTAVGAGEMVHKIPGVSALVDKVYGQPGLSRTSFAEAHRELAPTSTSEKVGSTGAKMAAFALAPGESIPAAMASNALISGAETGGDPGSMAVSGALAGAGGVASKGLGKMANAIREGQAGTVSATRTADLAKRGLTGLAKKNAMNDPMWMQAQATNTEKFANMVKQYGLTGNPTADAAVIAKAPARDQEVLSALSRQLDPSKHQLGHEWSLAELGASMAPSALLGAANPAMGVGSVPLILLARSLMKKYPGYAAKGMDAAGSMAPAAGRVAGGAAGLGFQEDDPLVQELIRRNGGGDE